MPEPCEMSREELEQEVRRLRSSIPTSCPTCRGKWATYMGSWDKDGYTLRCHGCLKSVANCTCR